MNLTPFVVTKTGYGDRSADIYSRLLEDRIIILFGEINDNVAASIIAQLLFLEALDKNKDIYLYINSPGGSVTAGLSIYDTMNFISCSVVTIGIGLCASMGAFLLASGAIGKREALENTEIMIHQPIGGAEGKASDIMIACEEIIKLKKKLNAILAKQTKKDIDTIEKDTLHDHFMNTEEALSYGIIDKIIKNKNE